MCPLHSEASSHLPPHPIPPGCHSALAFHALCHTSNSHWLSILHMVILKNPEIIKWDLNKPKSFCTKKETISKVKRQPSEWEKIIANETTDKELISKIHKQFMPLNTRKTNNPIKKWAEAEDKMGEE